MGGRLEFIKAKGTTQRGLGREKRFSTSPEGGRRAKRSEDRCRTKKGKRSIKWDIKDQKTKGGRER